MAVDVGRDASRMVKKRKNKRTFYSRKNARRRPLVAPAPPGTHKRPTDGPRRSVPAAGIRRSVGARSAVRGSVRDRVCLPADEGSLRYALGRQGSGTDWPAGNVPATWSAASRLDDRAGPPERGTPTNATRAPHPRPPTRRVRTAATGSAARGGRVARTCARKSLPLPSHAQCRRYSV